jgi:DNA anti-recombination protein RmuC
MFPECGTQAGELKQQVEELQAAREKESDSHYARVAEMGGQLAEAASQAEYSASEAKQIHSATLTRFAQLEARLADQKERHQMETIHLSDQLRSRTAALSDATSQLTEMMAAHATEV